MTEYIITEEQLEGIMDDVEADKHYKNISSRHAPPPKFTKNCMCDKYTNCIDCQAHNTTIRNATLDEVKVLLLKLQEKFSNEEMREDIPLKVSQRMGIGRVLMQQVIKVTESLRTKEQP